MIQEAILFTKDNAAMIVEHLDDTDTVEMLMEDYGYMLDTHDILVLCRSILDGDDFACVSYVVTVPMFITNNPGHELNDKTFTKVNRF